MSDIEHWQAENARLRELYENAVGNRERFGWTINHLLECDETLRVTNEQLAGAVEERDQARANADEAWKWVEKACAALGVKTVFEIPDTTNQ